MFKIKNKKDLVKLTKRFVLNKYDKKKGYYTLNKKLKTSELIKAMRYLKDDYKKYDLRKFKDNPATRGKLRRDFTEFFKLSQNANAVPVHRTKKNKRTLAKLTGQSPRWKVFYPTVKNIKKVKGSKLIKLKSAIGNAYALYFKDFGSEKDFLINPEKVVKKLVDYYKKRVGKFMFFKFIVGRFESSFIDGQPYFNTPDELLSEFNKMIGQYSGAGTDKNYTDFFVGIHFYKSFKN